MIVPLKNYNGLLPQNFPSTFGSIYELNQDQLIQLLQFYDLSSTRDEKTLRNRLSEFIGLDVDFIF